MSDSPAQNDRPPQGHAVLKDRPPQGGSIDPLFRFHKLNEDGCNKAHSIACAFDELLRTLKSLCPEVREFSIVKTKLEEASFFAKKAMANDVTNQAADRPPQGQ